MATPLKEMKYMGDSKINWATTQFMEDPNTVSDANDDDALARRCIFGRKMQLSLKLCGLSCQKHERMFLTSLLSQQQLPPPLGCSALPAHWELFIGPVQLKYRKLNKVDIRYYI